MKSYIIILLFFIICNSEDAAPYNAYGSDATHCGLGEELKDDNGNSYATKRWSGYQIVSGYVNCIYGSGTGGGTKLTVGQKSTCTCVGVDTDAYLENSSGVRVTSGRTLNVECKAPSDQTDNKASLEITDKNYACVPKAVTVIEVGDNTSSGTEFWSMTTIPNTKTDITKGHVTNLDNVVIGGLDSAQFQFEDGKLSFKINLSSKNPDDTNKDNLYQLSVTYEGNLVVAMRVDVVPRLSAEQQFMQWAIWASAFVAFLLVCCGGFCDAKKLDDTVEKAHKDDLIRETLLIVDKNAKVQKQREAEVEQFITAGVKAVPVASEEKVNTNDYELRL